MSLCDSPFWFLLFFASSLAKVKLTENQIVMSKINKKTLGKMKKNDYLYNEIKKHSKKEEQ